ncbi:MAG: response regulator [Chitinivibrionales bacterium]|nr:response regulator [Chitinivibrionales bacterium]
MKKKLLLVDDEDSILFAFEKILSSPEVSVDTARDTHMALERISSNTYHAVVADLRLTGVDDYDGLIIIKELKKMQPRTKVILITAYGGDEIKDLAFSVGTDFYLEKPVAPHQVKDLLSIMGIYHESSA